MMAIFEPAIRKLAKGWAVSRTAKLNQGSPLITLTKLLKQASATRYGQTYGFANILQQRDVYKAFSESVPVIDYGDWVAWLGEKGPTDEEGALPLKNQAWPGRIDMFCLSSGTTTGRTKFVPYSKQMAAVNRRAAFDFFASYLSQKPEIAPLLSRTLYLSGSTNLERTQHGVISGDMSGLTKYLAPKLLDGLVLPSRKVSSLEPWEVRLKCLVDVCLQENDIGVISGIPIWQLTLLEAVREKAGKPISQVMPKLRFLIHGGMSIAPYREQIAECVGPQVQFLEVYAASEAGIAAFQLPGEKGMRFFEGYDVFFEFEDENGDIWLSDQLKPHQSYRLLISSCSGLWRYRIGDCLVFDQTDPLILSHVSRDKTTSAFDEKVTEREIEEAMMGMPDPVADFSLGPNVDARRHAWFLVTTTPRSQAWLEQLDMRLRATNQDYDDYRGDGRIAAPILVPIADRAAYLKLLGREEGGQRKFPRLLSPVEVTRALETFGD